MKLSIPELFDHLNRVISSSEFLKMESLGGEVPFFICPFDPADMSKMSELYPMLVNNLQNEKGLKVLKINLYYLSVEMIKNFREGLWEEIISSEKGWGKKQLFDLLQSVLDPETQIIPAIKAKMVEKGKFDVMFITGVGEVFPYIRSHTILNNLQPIAKDSPTVMFFPGKYSFSKEGGSSLDLFGRMTGDKYYRAFNIINQ